MKPEAKKNLVAASLYITLAIMIVTIVCITVVSVANRAKKSTPEDGIDNSISTRPTDAENSNGTEETKPTQEERPTEESTEQTTEKQPDPTENSSAPEEPVDTQVVDPLPDSYTLPCLGHVSKGYEAELPVWSNTMEDYRIHDGIDVASELDAEVYSCAAGTVESVYEDPLMGHAITVYHGGGLRSTYLGLNGNHPSNISAGTEVAAGQVIGYVGESALIECADPVHLHFVMTMEEQTVDPLDYIDYESAVLSDSIEFED